ncbi:MAG: hypothetical protein MZW92_76250 [Comamonadaceae bacterium]|nr:hypothetical protein [Comamonadaceae bacterium]
MTAPDPRRALDLYRAHAAGYDASAERTMPLRRRTVARLALRPGDTGARRRLRHRTFLRPAAAGRGSGRDASSASNSARTCWPWRRRAAQSEGWHNVALIEAAMESAEIPLRGGRDPVQLHPRRAALSRPPWRASSPRHGRAPGSRWRE